MKTHTLLSLFFLPAAIMTTSISGSSEAPVSVVVDAASAVRTMAGGIGASWHAIQQDLPPYSQDHYEFPIRKTAPRGSAYGGNPPLRNEKAWQELSDHARWLGLNWIRVEISQRMYEPDRGVFDWDNEEMQTLYRILDTCQSAGADVFLTQMWGEVEWNAFPNVHPLQSAPKDVEAFADGLARLLEHLVKQKNYTCIRWLCISNEPGFDWSWWIGPRGHEHSITPALQAVREKLDQNGIDVPLSGPDWTNPPETGSDQLPQPIDFDAWLGAYDIHSYNGPGEETQRTWSDWAAWAHRRGKPCFLSEMGDMSLGWGDSNPGPKSFEAALSNAETVIRGLHAGLDAFNRWSFVNRGDLDGQWQLVRTWDIENQQYYETVDPEPVAYYGFAMLTRFLSKNSTVLETHIEQDSDATAPDRLFLAALRSPRNQITILLLNRSDRPREIALQLKGAFEAVHLAKYQLTESKVNQADFALSPDTVTAVSETIPIRDSIPAQSITVYTTYILNADEPGIVSD